MGNGSSEVVWAPRVRHMDIRRPYETEAQGRLDEELLEEVGIALYTRCDSWCRAYEARRGRIHCPRCEAAVEHSGPDHNELHCGCGWQTTWKAYYRTIRRHQLHGNEQVVDICRAYQERYRQAASPRDKMLAIEALLHAFHLMLAMPRWNVKEKWIPGRCAAVNLITGNYHEVIALLDSPAYGPNASPELLAERQRWRQVVARTSRLWNDEKLQHFQRYDSD
ncbi:MAG: hypothetical protein ACYC6L_06070 [Anaerolineae bacterium]